MKPATNPTCPRLFEAEALRDGRLTGTEVARFQTHLGVCATCAHEVEAMQALAEALRPPANLHAADQLHVRRERTRLLAAFDASLVPAPRARVWRPAFAALALLTVLTLAFVFSRSRAVPSVTTSLDPVKVQADNATQWSRQTVNELETLTLQSGTLSIRVDHRLPHRRLLVILPDGELEDIGTTFTVSAAAARTTQVTVQEGSVALRLRELPALTLRAGDSWSPAPEPVIAAPVSTPAPAPNARGTKPTSSTAPTPSVSAPEPTAAVAVAADAAADFRVAMSSFTSGDNARAASLFATFLTQHPRDPRAEDAAYLRVLALQRAGNSPGIKQAASDYLTRYPHGFRHAEVEPLSR